MITVIDDWLISSLWELSSQRGVEYINMTIQREEFSDKEGFKLQNLWMAILREKKRMADQKILQLDADIIRKFLPTV